MPILLYINSNQSKIAARSALRIKAECPVGADVCFYLDKEKNQYVIALMTLYFDAVVKEGDIQEKVGLDDFQKMLALSGDTKITTLEMRHRLLFENLERAERVSVVMRICVLFNRTSEQAIDVKLFAQSLRDKCYPQSAVHYITSEADPSRFEIRFNHAVFLDAAGAQRVHDQLSQKIGELNFSSQVSIEKMQSDLRDFMHEDTALVLGGRLARGTIFAKASLYEDLRQDEYRLWDRDMQSVKIASFLVGPHGADFSSGALVFHNMAPPSYIIPEDSPVLEGSAQHQCSKEIFRIIGSNQEPYRPFIDSFAQKNFSQALRRLCTGSNSALFEQTLHIAQILLDPKNKFSFDVNEVAGDKKQAAIHHAGIAGHVALYDFLITQGADPQLLDGDGVSGEAYKNNPIAASAAKARLAGV